MLNKRMVNPSVFFFSLLLLFPAKGYAVEQPIQFNHYKHTQQLELECVLCHTGVRNQVRATLPSVEICIGCHEEAVTDSPEEEKIREYYSRGEEIPWKRLFRVPSHVFFSHRRHVTVAGLNCTKCHGDMAMQKKPPRTAPMKISMNYCLSCHRQLQASTDCVSCHH